MYAVPDSPQSIESRSFMLLQWTKLDLFRSEIDRYTQEYLITAQQTAFGCWNVHQRVKDEAGFDHLEIAQPIRKPLKHKQKVSVESSFKGFYPIPSSFDAILLEKLLHRRDGFLRSPINFAIGPSFNDCCSVEVPVCSEVVNQDKIHLKSISRNNSE